MSAPFTRATWHGFDVLNADGDTICHAAGEGEVQLVLSALLLHRYMTDFAVKAGWLPAVGEGVFEFVTRKHYEQGVEDAKHSSCTWSNDDEGSDTWETSCRKMFRLDEGTPADNKMAHCCYCGKALITDAYKESEDEDSN